MLPNSPEFKARQKENVVINKALIWELKQQPCEDCKLWWHPHAMTFDHVNRSKGFLKGVNAKKISSLVHYNPIIFERMLRATSVVCLNCHIVRELKRDANDPKVSPYKKEVLIAMLKNMKRGALRGETNNVNQSTKQNGTILREPPERGHTAGPLPGQQAQAAG